MNMNGFKTLPFAVSSMQGWRKTMEDAHIAIPNLETQYDVPQGTSLYAVFDGHGGKEVSLFCAKYFVSTLVELESFKARAYREALVEAFHKIDEMLYEPKYKAEIDQMAGTSGTDFLARLNVPPQDDEEEDDDDELYLLNRDDNSRNSPAIDEEVTAEEERASKNSLYDDFGPDAKSDGDSEDDSREKTEGEEEEEVTEVEKDDEKPRKKIVQRAESMRINIGREALLNKVMKAKEEEQRKRAKETGESEHEILDALEGYADEETDNALSLEAEKEKTAEATPASDLEVDMTNAESKGTLTKAEALNIMFKMLGFNKPTPSEEDKTETKKVEGQQPRFTQVLENNLPTHAGTTACVALFIEGKLYVANAGDSRAVLCRDRKAFPMSFDHKPEQDKEKERIEKAGGWVTAMGRVCGNLNLSRCIGDLKYKQNKNIDVSQQIITAEPDVRVVDIEKEDLFLVVACDGVWDILTNDGIVDFVSKSFIASSKGSVKDESLTLKNTVEQVFNHCLCDDPMTDGKGGDNMTAVIVCLKPLEEVVSAFWKE